MLMAVYNQQYTYWLTIKKIDVVVTGKGPWLITVEAKDSGLVAGLMAAVYLDGVLFSATGSKSNDLKPFEISTKDAKNWNTLSFDSNWKEAKEKPKGCDSPYWGNWIKRFQDFSGTKAKPVWKDSCDDVGSTNYFRLVVEKL